MFINEDNRLHKPLKESSSVLPSETFLDQPNRDLSFPPGFKPFINHRTNVHQQQSITSIQDSQSTDEGISHDTSNISMFESVRCDSDLESIYHECYEDVAVINKLNSMMIRDNNKLECCNQSYRPRYHWNSNKVKYQSNYTRNQFDRKPRLKKPINPNKAPLPPEKKKNSMSMKILNSLGFFSFKYIQFHANMLLVVIASKFGCCCLRFCKM